MVESLKKTNKLFSRARGYKIAHGRKIRGLRLKHILLSKNRNRSNHSQKHILRFRLGGDINRLS